MIWAIVLTAACLYYWKIIKPAMEERKRFKQYVAYKRRYKA